MSMSPAPRTTASQHKKPCRLSRRASRQRTFSTSTTMCRTMANLPALPRPLSSRRLPRQRTSSRGRRATRSTTLSPSSAISPSQARSTRRTCCQTKCCTVWRSRWCRSARRSRRSASKYLDSSMRGHEPRSSPTPCTLGRATTSTSGQGLWTGISHRRTFRSTAQESIRMSMFHVRKCPTSST